MRAELRLQAGLLALLLGLGGPASAVKLADVVLPDQWKLGEQTLLLNGAGLRLYGFLGIKVYAAALYLPTPLHSSEAVLDSDAPKVLHMQFIRSASLADTRKAWALYFEKNCPAPCAVPAAKLEQFYALLPETLAGDTQTLIFAADRVSLLRNGVNLGAVEGRAFCRLLLATFIGAAPTTPELKAALLGAP